MKDWYNTARSFSFMLKSLELSTDLVTGALEDLVIIVKFYLETLSQNKWQVLYETVHLQNVVKNVFFFFHFNFLIFYFHTIDNILSWAVR